MQKHTMSQRTDDGRRIVSIDGREVVAKSINVEWHGNRFQLSVPVKAARRNPHGLAGDTILYLTPRLHDDREVIASVLSASGAIQALVGKGYADEAVRLIATSVYSKDQKSFLRRASSEVTVSNLPWEVRSKWYQAVAKKFPQAAQS